MKDVAEQVKRGERTAANNLSMTLKRKAGEKAVFEQVRKIAPEGCEVHLWLDTVVVTIKAIDMTCRRSVRTSLVPSPSASGDQQAYVRLPRRIANALVGNRLTFGYSSCWVSFAPERPLDTKCAAIDACSVGT
ncbi:gag-like protein [Anopheles sinensis]|uniref:Gag-like protein n=1 Tax=Anopheles sinensis TaxID=74873 RepID=A0A084VKU6_ANOSI|nr:gag-like protein [Anopheles sinensis]